MRIGFVLCLSVIAMLTAQSVYAASSQYPGSGDKGIPYSDSMSIEDSTCLIMAMSNVGGGDDLPQHCDETIKKYWKLLCKELQKQGYQCPTDPAAFWELMLKLYDKNDNGKLDPEEVIELIKKILPWGIERGLIIDYWRSLNYSMGYDRLLRLLRDLFCRMIDDPNSLPLCLNIDTFAKCKQRVVASCCEQTGGVWLPPLFPGDPVSCYTGGGIEYRQCFEREIQACESLL